MKTVLLIPALGLMLLHGAVLHSHEECPCPMAAQQSDWCDVCDVGYVGSMEIGSRYLFDVVDPHGHSLDLSTFECKSCRTAIDTEGFCETHRTGFVGGQSYFSRIGYELARGEVVDVSGIECSVCRKNARGQGWCETCRVGRVGSVAIHDRQAYLRLTRALHILHLANQAAERCEHCAAALVTDTECPECRISYRDGKALPRAKDPRAPLPELDRR